MERLEQVKHVGTRLDRSFSSLVFFPSILLSSFFCLSRFHALIGRYLVLRLPVFFCCSAQDRFCFTPSTNRQQPPWQQLSFHLSTSPGWRSQGNQPKQKKWKIWNLGDSGTSLGNITRTMKPSAGSVQANWKYFEVLKQKKTCTCKIYLK